eukprot:391448-Rhodomonas_salina.6
MHVLATQLLAAIDQQTLDKNSPLALGTVSDLVLQTVLALLREESIDAAACLHSEDELVVCVMEALKGGCSPKFIGTQMARVLLTADASDRSRACDLMSQGGYSEYEGHKTTVAVRHTGVGTCMLATANMQYVGPFVGGRMMGRGKPPTVPDLPFSQHSCVH